MKKGLIAFALALCLASMGFAQNLHDPNDGIYDSIDRWSARGYLSMLPPVRPYPAQLVNEYLNTVVQVGDSASVEEAKAYLAALDKDSRKVHVTGTAQVAGKKSDKMYSATASIDGHFAPTDWFTGSISFDLDGSTKAVGDEVTVPGTWSSYPDMVNDDSVVGPIHILQDWNSTAALGTSRYWFQAGYNRTSFGPFVDSSVVVGDQAGHAGHFSAAYRGDGWNFSTLFLSLTASAIPDATLNSDTTKWSYNYPDKYFSLHSLDFSLSKNFEFGFFESVMWGGRVDPRYLVPFAMLFQEQAVTDDSCEDNSFLGIHARYLAFPGLEFLGELYVDDFSFKDALKLKVDSKYKFAAEAGLVYAPASGPLSRISCNYTAIMPYMGTHKSASTYELTDGSTDTVIVNYSNYTHMGASLGSDLLPNSDRFQIKTTWKLLDSLDGKLGAGIQRHGNASANSGVAMGTTSDGDLWDDGYAADDSNTTLNKTRFLSQGTLETLVNGSVGLEWQLPIPAFLGIMSASFDYVAEYGWNRGLVKDENSLVNYYMVTGKWRY